MAGLIVGPRRPTFESMNITATELKSIRHLEEASRCIHWTRWLTVGIGAIVCAIYWKSPVALAVWIYSGNAQSGSHPDAKYITMFLLGLYFVISGLVHWRGGWRERLILKLAKQCGVIKEDAA
jgi:hypothetical protein